MAVCVCVYASHDGFVREVLKDSERDFTHFKWHGLLNKAYFNELFT